MDIFSPAKRSEIMRSVRSDRTKPERVLRSGLHRLGFRFALSHRGLPGKPDIVLPRRRAVIFVHGCFWHGHSCSKGKRPQSNGDFWNTKIENNRARDQRVVSELKDQDWRVFTVWECQLSTIQKRESTVAELAKELASNGKEALQGN